MPMPVRKDDVKDRWITAAMVDYWLSFCKSRKYALMKRVIDPFPQPIRIGKSIRWSESAVSAWMARQVTSQDGEVELMPGSPTVTAPTFADEPRSSKLKQRYEAGATLDQLCSDFHIGKQTLSKLLRSMGTEMRAAGRKPSGNSVRSQHQPGWPQVVPATHSLKTQSTQKDRHASIRQA